MEEKNGYLKHPDNIYEYLPHQAYSRTLKSEDHETDFDRIYDEVAKEILDNKLNENKCDAVKSDGYMEMNHFKLNQQPNEYEILNIYKKSQIVYSELSLSASGGHQEYLDMSGIRKTNYADIKFN